MRILKLRLKNFKGILLGSLGKEEIDIDLSGLPDGIIALQGPNGAGKTTILDCLHPYRTMPFRSTQSLVDAVSGIGEKEVFFQTIDGSIYHSKLIINSKTRNIECYLYRKSPASNNWDTLADGRAEDYDREVQIAVIPEDLFFLSAFRAQNARSFVSVKKTELKKLFEELLGLEHYTLKAKNAEIKRKKVEENINVRSREIEGLNATISSLHIQYPDKTEMDNAKNEKSIIEGKIALFEKEIVQMKTKESAIVERVKNIDIDINNKESLAFEHKSSLTNRAESLKKKIIDYNDVLLKKDEILGAVNKVSDVSIELERVKSEIAEIHKGIQMRSGLIEQKAKIAKELAQTESDLKLHNEKLRVAKKNALILDAVPCSESEKQSCKLLSVAIEDQKKIPEIEKIITLLQSSVIDVQAKMGNIAEQINTISSSVPNNILQKESELSKNLSYLQSMTGQSDVIYAAQKEIAYLNDELMVLTKEMSSIDLKTAEDVQKLRKTKDGCVNEVTAVQIDINYAESEVKYLKEGLLTISKKIDEFTAMEIVATEREKSKLQLQSKVASLEKEMLPLKKDLAQWSVIEKAFGRDGIMAYDLETAAPAVSIITNTLLNEMGGRFAIRFETLRPKAGKKDDYVEVFDIKVLDIANGIEKSLVDLSGGELVWIDEAIARAIYIYHQRSSGSRVLTVYSDERDGDLDKNKKMEYINMKRKVLAEGGYAQEFFISHTPEVIELADAVISINNNGISIDIRNGNDRTVVMPEIENGNSSQHKTTNKRKNSQTTTIVDSPTRSSDLALF
jgi:exonuclease SbcC